MQDADERKTEANSGEMRPPEDHATETDAPSFLHLVNMLAMNALLALGAMPSTEKDEKKPEKDLQAAKFAIDMLGILEEKTKSNLTSNETHALSSTLYQLRMLFVEASKS